MKNKKGVKPNTAKQATGRPPKRVSRKAVRRRRMIKRIAGLVVAIAAVIGLFVAASKLLFVVKTVNVNGTSIFTAEEITEFLNIPPQQSIFKVKSEQLEQNLEQEYKYIENADVVKRFPDIIEVNITDSIESFFTAEDEYKIYSQGFKYLRSSSEPPMNAVCLEVNMEDEKLLEQVKNILQLFEKHQLDKITRLSVTDQNMIKAEYDGRLEMNFGTMLDIDYKIKMCKKIIDEKIPQSEAGTIDATNGGEIVYTRQ